MGQLVFQATLGGQVNLVGPNTASTFNINVPAVAGNMVTTGDTGTVTNTMCATSVYTAPGTIGSGTPNTGSFTSLAYSTTLTGGTGIVNLGSGQFYKDASGNVGIGTSSPTNNLTIGNGGGGNNLGVSLSRGATTNFYEAYDGTKTYIAGCDASISYVKIGSLSSTPVGFVVGNSEKMRIDTSGNLLVGTTTTAAGQAGHTVVLNSTATALNTFHGSGVATGNAYHAFYYNAGYIGGITQNGTTGVLYNLTSDYRLKNNPQPLTGAKEFIMALQPKKWQWWDGSGEGVGFIAHEFMEVAKYSGHGEKDAVDDEGKIIAQSIQPSSAEVMANLVAFIQELKAELDAAKADIATLKGQ